VTKLFVISFSTGAAPQEADSSARVVGAYTDPDVAVAVRSVAWGVGASVTELEVDVIDPELRRELKARGLELPLPTTAPRFGNGRSGKSKLS
jgi:hypothetical protein